jgi:hypothetical protein
VLHLLTHEFREECAHMLLFLKHVERITVMEWLPEVSVEL